MTKFYVWPFPMSLPYALPDAVSSVSVEHFITQTFPEILYVSH